MFYLMNLDVDEKIHVSQGKKFIFIKITYSSGYQ